MVILLSTVQCYVLAYCNWGGGVGVWLYCCPLYSAVYWRTGAVVWGCDCTAVQCYVLVFFDWWCGVGVWLYCCAVLCNGVL